MKRSTYSLILMDDVVAAIDRLAAQQGTSRSNLINQILAEHVSCVTPEQQMRQIFACLTQQMNSAFRIQEQGSDAMLSILGSVQYKYRPTIRYSVELHREMHGEKVGILKISCHTKSNFAECNSTILFVLGTVGTGIRRHRDTGTVSNRIQSLDTAATSSRHFIK